MEEKLGSDRLVKKLVEVGLSPYEAKAYMALLQGKELTAIQASELSGVPKTRIYDILITLERKGFCKSHPGKVTKYIALNPGVSLHGYIRAQREEFLAEAEEKERVANELVSTLGRVSKANSTPLEYIWVMKDQYQIAKAYSGCVLSSKKEVLSLEKAPYAPPEIQYRAVLDALANGVKVRSIYQLDPKSVSKDILPFILRTIEKGADVRFVQRIPSKIAMFDGREVWVAIEDPLSFKGGFVAVVMSHPSAVEPFRVLFEKLWDEGKSYSRVKKMIEDWS